MAWHGSRERAGACFWLCGSLCTDSTISTTTTPLTLLLAAALQALSRIMNFVSLRCTPMLAHMCTWACQHTCVCVRGRMLPCSQELLWIAREGLKAPLPPDWKPWCERMGRQRCYVQAAAYILHACVQRASVAAQKTVSCCGPVLPPHAMPLAALCLPSPAALCLPCY